MSVASLAEAISGRLAGGNVTGFATLHTFITYRAGLNVTDSAHDRQSQLSGREIADLELSKYSTVRNILSAILNDIRKIISS